MPKLSKNSSIYLDALRLTAAFFVFLAHSRNFLVPGLFRIAGTFGHEAVAVFFVLSGFVIAFVQTEKENDAVSYVVARFARIYPVALLAILVTLIADAIGMHFAFGQYRQLDAQFHFYHEPDWPALLAYLSFTNEIWFNHAVVGTAEPYWSLGFEVWYYVLFGIHAFVSRRLRSLVLAATAIFCGVKIVLYFPLWLLGCVTYRALTRLRMARSTAVSLFVLSGISLMVFVFYGRRVILPASMYHLWPVSQEIRNVVFYYGIGVLVAANIVAFHFATEGRNFWGARTGGAIRWAAGASFTLYLMHQPLEVMVTSLFPVVRTNNLYGLVAMVAVLLAIVLLAEVGERRKRVVATHVRPLLQKMSMRLSRSA